MNRPVLALLVVLCLGVAPATPAGRDLESRRLLYISAERGGEIATLMLLDLSLPLLPLPLVPTRDESGDPLTVSQATISPDGRRAAFRYGPPGGEGRIYLVELDRPGVVTRLTADEADESMPAWSPDGTMLALISERGGTPDLYVVDAHGGSLFRRLTNNPSRQGSPAWHPDSDQLAYVDNQDGNEEIYLTDALGARPRRLTTNSWPDLDPAWHPDGRRLALVTTVPRQELVLVEKSPRQAGRTKSIVGPASPYIDLTPTWDYAEVVVEKRDIVLLDTVDGSLEFLVSSSGADLQPTFSADGRFLAFASDRSGDFEIYVYELRTRALRQVTFNSAADNMNPLWVESR